MNERIIFEYRNNEAKEKICINVSNVAEVSESISLYEKGFIELNLKILLVHHSILIYGWF